MIVSCSDYLFITKNLLLSIAITCISKLLCVNELTHSCEAPSSKFDGQWTLTLAGTSSSAQRCRRPLGCFNNQSCHQKERLVCLFR